MPVKDGINALKDIIEIEKAEKSKHVPAVALTAKAIKGDSEQLLKNGFDEYLSKPIDTDELDRILKKFLLHTAKKVQGPTGQTDIIQRHAEATSEALGIDIDTVNELIDEFIDNASSYISSLEKAINEGNRKTIISLAHKFRGIAAI